MAFLLLDISFFLKSYTLQNLQLILNVENLQGQGLKAEYITLP